MNSRARFFYGWVIVAVATLSLVVSNGLSIGGIPVFYKFVQNDLVSTGAVAADKIQSVYGLAPALTFLFAGLLAPIAGFLLHRFNARTMMVVGCVILGGGLLVYSQATRAVHVYLAHSLMGTSLGFVGVLVSTVLVSNWFKKNRGTALGIVLTGTSFGGVIIPQLATPLIQAYGWRTAMVAVSLIIWLILLPSALFLIKNRPLDIGEVPDGGSVASSDALPGSVPRPELDGLTLVQALKTPLFWFFSVTAALIFYAIFVVSQQLNLYLQNPTIGFSAPQAAGVQSLLFGLSVFGKFLYGFASDRLPITRVMVFSAATMFLSTLTFLYFDGSTIYLFAVLFGLNYGGTFVLLQLLVAEYFGLKEYGKILGAVTVIETIGGAAGTIITGRIADADGGDYRRAFYGLIIVTAVSFASVLVLNIMYKRRAVAP